MRARQTLRDCFSTYSSDVDEDKLDTTVHVQETLLKESVNPSRRLSLLSVLTGVISSFLSGYRLGVVNEPLESISLDLGFNGNSLAEGLVVTTCLGGTFLGFMVSGSITDIVGRRRGFHLSALPMIIGAFLSSRTESVEGMLLGRFLVVTGMGCRKGRSSEAEAEFEKSDRGHEPDIVKFSELFYGRHFRVVLIGSALYAFQQLSGISILLQPSLKVWGFHQTRETSA